MENLRYHWALPGKPHSTGLTLTQVLLILQNFQLLERIFFFIYLKQMLSEKWQDATPSKRSLCLLEKSLLLQGRHNFSSWDWHERGKAVPHLEVSVFLLESQRKEKYCRDPPSNYILNAHFQQHKSGLLSIFGTWCAHNWCLLASWTLSRLFFLLFTFLNPPLCLRL